MTPPKFLFTHHRDNFILSSDRSLLNLESINAAFATESMYWATPLSKEDLQIALDNSFCVGVYTSKASPDSGEPVADQQIGLVRCLTDYVTFAYLTDVYLLEEYRSLGLGKWMLQSINECIESGAFPALRRVLLITGIGKPEKFYKDTLGLERLDLESGGSCFLSRKGPACKV